MTLEEIRGLVNDLAITSGAEGEALDRYSSLAESIDNLNNNWESRYNELDKNYNQVVGQRDEIRRQYTERFMSSSKKETSESKQEQKPKTIDQLLFGLT